MAGDQPKRPAIANAELERDIRDGRTFSLAEAIGRLAGAGIMKGESPIARKQQAAAQIKAYLDRHLIDTPGALRAVMLRQVSESDLLGKHLDEPLTGLAAHVRQVLDSSYVLQELVRESDVEWGRVFGERPYFQKEGCTPHVDDPYTIESARGALGRLLDQLTTDTRR
jgi:hypothetical protein